MSWWLFGLMAVASANFAAQQPPNPLPGNQDPGQQPQPRQRQQGRRRQPRVFLLSYFMDNGQNGVYLATSEDGYKFKPMLEPNVPIMKSELGGDALTRDPCIMYGPDHQWHMAWTTGWWDHTFGHAHSKDLVHWTQQVVPGMVDIPEAVNAWAPEMNYDPVSQKFVLYWSSTVRGRFRSTAREDGDLGPEGEPLNHRFFFTTTSDFKTYSPTRLLWDPGFNCIDATMRRTRDGWLMFGKNETRAPKPAKSIFFATMPSPSGPFHMVDAKITGDYWCEGPTVIRVDGKVRVYFDRYTEDRWGAVESSDLKSWTDISDKIQMVRGARHGSIVAVPKEFADRVRELLRAKQ